MFVRRRARVILLISNACVGEEIGRRTGVEGEEGVRREEDEGVWLLFWVRRTLVLERKQPPVEVRSSKLVCTDTHTQ